jgi:hypothetical protein
LNVSVLLKTRVKLNLKSLEKIDADHLTSFKKNEMIKYIFKLDMFYVKQIKLSNTVWFKHEKPHTHIRIIVAIGSIKIIEIHH